MIFVQLDESEEIVLSVFAGPQDPAHWSGLAEIESSDPRYLAFLDSLPAHLREPLSGRDPV